MKQSSLSLVAVTLLAVAGTSVFGQAQSPNQPPSPARSRSNEIFGGWNDIGNKLVAMAKDFPEDKYDFKVQKDERTFGVIFPHSLVRAPRQSIQNSRHARAWIQSAMNALGGEDKLRAIHSIEIKGIGFRNELEQSERPEGPWMPDFYYTDEIRDFQNMRMKSQRQSRTLNSTAWDNSDWSLPVTIIVSGGVVARLAQMAFSPATAASAIDVEETLALDPLQVLLLALEAPDLHSEADTQLHGFLQHVVAFTWRGEAVRLLLNGFSLIPTCVEVTRARPMDYFQGPWGRHHGPNDIRHLVA